MNKLKIKFKKLAPNAVTPTYGNTGDACMDLTASSAYIEKGLLVCGTGIAFDIPEGYQGLIFQRSSVCKKNLILSNAVGVLDSGYKGEIFFKFRILDKANMGEVYHIGDRIGQIMFIPVPVIELEEVNELSESERGEGGFGSTGN